MDLSVIAAVFAVALLALGPLALLAAAALTFGNDSRPTDDRRPWLIG
jgi:hypothetical protein